MNFWRWLLRKCKEAMLLKWIKTPAGEVFAGMGITIYGIPLSILISFWFLLLILVGITIMVHGIRRN